MICHQLISKPNDSVYLYIDYIVQILINNILYVAIIHYIYKFQSIQITM